MIVYKMFIVLTLC